jgi:hypothetical protein
MTGSRATVASTELGGAFTAWDGYIDGVHVALEPGRRIVQAWRSDDFPADAPESYLELLLEPARGGSQVTIRHRELPAGQGPGILAGWDEFYFTPMERFFTAEAKRRAVLAPRPEVKRMASAGKRSKPAASKGVKRAAKPARRKPTRKPARKATRRPTRKAVRKPRS